MPSQFAGSKAGPSSKAGEGMARKAAARSGKPMMMDKHPKGMEVAMAKTTNRGKAAEHMGKGIPVDRGRTSGPTWTKKGMK